MRDMGATGLVEIRIKSDDRSGMVSLFLNTEPPLNAIGNRRLYAFAEFRSEDDAIGFYERNYPALDIANPHGSSIRIPIEYSRERRHIANPDDWKCTMVNPKSPLMPSPQFT